MEILDVDPLDQTVTRYHYDEIEKRSYIHTAQNPEYLKTIVDAATDLRNDESFKDRGIKNSWMLAALIPKQVMNEMITKYHIAQPLREQKRVMKIIQRDYPHLMTASGKY